MVADTEWLVLYSFLLAGWTALTAENVFSRLQNHILSSLQKKKCFSRLQKNCSLSRLQNTFICSLQKNNIWIAYKKAGFVIAYNSIYFCCSHFLVAYKDRLDSGSLQSTPELCIAYKWHFPMTYNKSVFSSLQSLNC